MPYSTKTQVFVTKRKTFLHYVENVFLLLCRIPRKPVDKKLLLRYYKAEMLYSFTHMEELE